ncbi:MAG: hypothetical protein ACJ76H_09560 [Bacteriovoracaceae bacterium]
MSEEEKYSIPDEVEEWIGLKKSEYLSKLIENVKEGDFGFEEYHLFDHKIQETVEHPDRSFEENDDSYVIQTFVRTYSDEKMFHHVVVGSTYVDKKNEVEVFLLILSFVTRSENVVGIFSVGAPRARPTLN